MDHREPYDLSIVEAGVALRDGSLTAMALTESVLSRLEATEPLLNAWHTPQLSFPALLGISFPSAPTRQARFPDKLGMTQRQKRVISASV